MSKKKGFLKCVLSVDLFNELTGDSLIGNVGVRLGGDAHRCVLEDRNVGTEVTDELCRQLAFFGDARSQFSSVVLDVLGYCQ